MIARSVCAVIVMGLLAGCSQETGKDNETTAEVTRSPMPKPVSSDAAAARSVVQHYFGAIARKDFAAAYRLWGHEGADTGGSAAKFAASFDSFKTYKAIVGIPTEVRIAGGMQYVLIPIKLHVEFNEAGRIENRRGPVMLRRSADRRATDTNSQDWRIWGTDIRVPH